jgi:ComF family protein
LIEIGLIQDLLQLVFPRHCPGCDNVLGRGDGAVCLHCLLELEQTQFHLQPADNELYFRLAGRVPLTGASAMYYFDKRGRFKKMMQALKYGNRPQVGRFLGQHYGEMLVNHAIVAQADAILPVPLHRSRFAERGYNQSEMICEGLGKALGIQVNTKSLVRTAKTDTQTKKSQTERWENVESVFGIAKPIEGRLILVDDVITTGATLEACIKALYAQPVPPVSLYVISLGMARHG